jgi:hypothetical protein
VGHSLSPSRTLVTPYCKRIHSSAGQHEVAVSPLCVLSRANPSGLGHAATIYSSVQGPPGVETPTIAKTNTEKITKEILEGLSEDTDDSDNYDVESGGEDSEDRPWQPSHAVFRKSTIKQSHLDNMRGRYFRDMSIVRADVDRTIPALEENEVVIFRRFFKARLRFPLSRFVVEVLKTYQIFLHQNTPGAVIRMGIFVWAVRSQGLEPSARCFCSMHELSYETKAWGKEQYHNNFGCYSFVARSGASYLVPTFWKRWPRAWMEEWFYVKNDLKAREDIKEIIMRPI